eukprot:PLAT5094.1.p1 GENE.PLAT5094.1~~PLAT5094.1.p1  ORF type:complete len:119 (+),score=46.64 PLAT5094.1:44-358(+)
MAQKLLSGLVGIGIGALAYDQSKRTVWQVNGDLHKDIQVIHDALFPGRRIPVESNAFDKPDSLEDEAVLSLQRRWNRTLWRLKASVAAAMADEAAPAAEAEAVE